MESGGGRRMDLRHLLEMYVDIFITNFIAWSYFKQIVIFFFYYLFSILKVQTARLSQRMKMR